MQQQNTKGAIATTIDTDFKKACTAISKAHLYNKDVREAIYMENFDTINICTKLKEEIEKIKTTLPAGYKNTINFDNIINSECFKCNDISKYYYGVEDLKDRISSNLYNIKNANSIYDELLKNSFEALKANLEQDLKYIKKHIDQTSKIKRQLDLIPNKISELSTCTESDKVALHEIQITQIFSYALEKYTKLKCDVLKGIFDKFLKVKTDINQNDNTPDMIKEKINDYIKKLGQTINESTHNITHIKYVYGPLMDIVKKCNELTGTPQSN